MTDKQPEALRLADALDAGENFYAESSLWFDSKLADAAGDAAAELRRLHAENAALLSERRNLGAAIERQYSAAEQIADRVMRLEGQRDELLDALQSLISDNHPEYIPSKLWKKARAAIAKAEGENQ